MPMYNFQSETPGTPASQDIGMYPVYQGFLGPAYINGIQVPLQTQKHSFFNIWPNVVQQLPVTAVGNGTAGPYTLNLPILPNNSPPLNPPLECILRGHVDITGIMAASNNPGAAGMPNPLVNVDPLVVTSLQAIGNSTVSPAIIGTIPAVPTTSVQSAVYFTSLGADGSNVIVADSGQFLSGNVNYGLLMQPGSAPYGNKTLSGGYSTTSNTVNYLTGVAVVTFPVAIPAGVNINSTCYFFQTGLPRSMLFYNNVLTLRSPPDQQYLVELDAYLSPAAFFATNQAIQFAYMCEYLARGAARKILSDTGDNEQLAFYEPLFREQEMLVWKRSQRQWTASRTETIYSQGINQGQSGFNNVGGSSF
jgi:hypothetical protein